ncbi:unnamed protein product [Brassicogethes aeneus]|uniref:PNPLA domain-containing protein n=1 Tax=Brassicogethes aeneus TaxID=1431903 RepID=A0A9P0B1R1_BRAAE|nr:unnamed protein product [Brassicogethes aeneus]
MSLNHWKIFLQLKDHISKLTNDKTMQINFSKDLVNVLQKLPPSYYTKELIKLFETQTNPPKEQKENEAKESSSNYIPTVIKGIKDKIGVAKEEKPKIIIPKWKQQSSSIQASVFNKTRHIILSIQLSDSEHSIQHLIRSLLDHIEEYPEARGKAVKLGAIRLFLRLRKTTTNESMLESIHEGLSSLGYANPVPKKGIRILAIDGGGIRGLLVIEMIKKLEELTGKRVHELFDFFCGVSTGSILAYSMAIHHRPLESISEQYECISKEVFQQSALWGTGNLVWTHSYYETALWEQKLKDHLGDHKLIDSARNPNCPKICTVSAVVNQTRLSAYLFRNYSLPWRYHSEYLGSSHHEVWQAARASSAAPTYFDEFKLGNLIHQDGGILVNNPTAIALHEVKLLWPDTPIQCIVSFGTGRSVLSTSDFITAPQSANTTSWANKFYKILDSATDTEAVHTILNDLLPPNIYYRFNPYLTEMISMVETDSKKLQQLKRDALMYLRRNEDKFQEAACALTMEKSYMQKLKDYINLQRDIHGI